MKTVKFKIPKTFGACADKLFTLRAERAKIQKQADALEVEEKAIKSFLIENLSKEDQTGAVGHLAQATITTKVVPSCKDWKALEKWILKTKDFSVLGRSLKAESIRERWDMGKKIPGVEPFTVLSVSCTKK